MRGSSRLSLQQVRQEIALAHEAARMIARFIAPGIIGSLEPTGMIPELHLPVAQRSDPSQQAVRVVIDCLLSHSPLSATVPHGRLGRHPQRYVPIWTPLVPCAPLVTPSR